MRSTPPAQAKFNFFLKKCAPELRTCHTPLSSAVFSTSRVMPVWNSWRTFSSCTLSISHFLITVSNACCISARFPSVRRPILALVSSRRRCSSSIFFCAFSSSLASFSRSASSIFTWESKAARSEVAVVIWASPHRSV